MNTPSFRFLLNQGFSFLNQQPCVEPLVEWLNRQPTDLVKPLFVQVLNELVYAPKRHDEVDQLLSHAWVQSYPSDTKTLSPKTPPLPIGGSASQNPDHPDMEKMLSINCLRAQHLDWLEKLETMGWVDKRNIQSPEVMLSCVVHGQLKWLQTHAHKKMFQSAHHNHNALAFALDQKDHVLFRVLTDHIPFSTSQVKKLLLSSLAKGQTQRWDMLSKDAQWGPKTKQALRSPSNSLNVLRACLNAPDEKALKHVLTRRLNDLMTIEHVPTAEVVTCLSFNKLPVVKYLFQDKRFKERFEKECCMSTLMYSLLYTANPKVVRFAMDELPLPFDSSSTVLDQLSRHSYQVSTSEDEMSVWSMVVPLVNLKDNLKRAPIYVWTAFEDWLTSHHADDLRASVLSTMLKEDIRPPEECEQLCVYMEKAHLERHVDTSHQVSSSIKRRM